MQPRIAPTIACALAGLRLRAFERADAPALAELANDRSIWLQVRDSFPHPYGIGDAVRFIAMVSGPPRLPVWAMEWQGRLAGALGVTPGEDIQRRQAEVGYWVGAPFRGLGLASAALDALCPHVFAEGRFQRLVALPFVRNAASSRVLEKAGFQCEGRLRQSAIKDGEVLDQWLYARLATGNPDPEAN